MDFLNTWLTIIDFHCSTNKMIRSRDGETGRGGEGGRGGPRILEIRKWRQQRRVFTTGHPRFSDLPPFLRSSHKKIPSSYWLLTSAQFFVPTWGIQNYLDVIKKMNRLQGKCCMLWIDVMHNQSYRPESSSFFVWPNGFGEHLFSNFYSMYLGCITLAVMLKVQKLYFSMSKPINWKKKSSKNINFGDYLFKKKFLNSIF